MTDFEKYLKQTGEIGHVAGGQGVLVYCSGLSGARIWEKIVFFGGAFGLVWSIGAQRSEILLLSKSVEVGEAAVRSGEAVGVAVSSEALGRVVDVFGTPLDNKGAFKRAQIANFEREAPALIDRVRVSENLET